MLQKVFLVHEKGVGHGGDDDPDHNEALVGGEEGGAHRQADNDGQQDGADRLLGGLAIWGTSRAPNRAGIMFLKAGWRNGLL